MLIKLILSLKLPLVATLSIILVFGGLLQIQSFRLSSALKQNKQLRADIISLKSEVISYQIQINRLSEQLVTNDTICQQQLSRKNTIKQIFKAPTPAAAVNNSHNTTLQNNRQSVPSGVGQPTMEVVDNETNISVVDFINAVFGM